MANYLSAGVYGTEVDLSASVPSVATGVTAFAGKFTKGQAYIRKLVTNVDQLIEAFGTPTNDNFNDWYQCYNFLRNGSELYVVRAINDTELVENVYPEFINGNTYIEGEIVSHNGTKFQALKTTNVTPVEGTDWTETVNEYTNQKATMNAGLFVDVDNSISFDNDYIENSNEYEIKKDMSTLNTGIRFISKSPGMSGNNIKICLSDELNRGLDKASENSWNGLNGTVYDSGSSYDTDDVVFYTFTSNNTSVTKIYKSKSDANTNTPTNATYWEEVTHSAGDVINYSLTYTDINGNEKTVSSNFTSTVSNNADAPITVDNYKIVYSTKWASHTTFADLFETSLGEDELALVIFENDTLKETYIVSTKETGTDLDGNNIFIDNVLMESSNLVYSISSDNTPTLVQKVQLKGGTSTPVDESDLRRGYSLFENVEEFDVSIIISNDFSIDLQRYCLSISSDIRKDCITICGVPKSEVVGVVDPNQNVIDYVNTLNVESSYGTLYNNCVQIYDNYNAKYRWVNIAGAIAGSQVRTNNSADAWWANAGLDRGQIANISKIAYNPTRSERDALQKNKVNPIVSFPGQGNCVIWGQKTLLSRASAFDRLNVRQLFLVIEKAVNKAMKYFVFEPNDEFTRAQISAMINPFLENIKGRRGIYDYRTVCDETNNTAEVIDQNILKVAILIKPTRTAEYIQVQYVATRTDADLAQIAKSLP